MDKPKRPIYNMYISDGEGKINFEEWGVGLWEYESRNGHKYLSGKLPDGRRVQLWPSKRETPRNEEDEW